MNLVGDTNVSDFLSSWAAKGKVDHRHEIQKLKRSKALILQYEADEAGVHFLDLLQDATWVTWVTSDIIWLSEIENRIEPMSMQMMQHLAFLDRKGQPGS